MFTLPKPTLGNVTAISIPTTNLEASLRFYQQLGFAELFRADLPFPWIKISDGALLIMLKNNGKHHLSLTYYAQDHSGTVKNIEKAGIEISQLIEENDLEVRYMLTSPDGLEVCLVTLPHFFEQPEGPTMLTTPQEDYFNPEKYTNKVCGMFGELAHPVADLEKSIEFWAKLGFVAVSKFTSPYPWVIVTDGLSVVGLHQTNQFTQPAITYFAADMKDKIARLKENGVQGFTNQNDTNTTLKTPEGQLINLFGLG